MATGTALLWRHYRDAVGEAAEARQAMEASAHNAELTRVAKANTRRLAELYQGREKRPREAVPRAAKLPDELEEPKENPRREGAPRPRLSPAWRDP